MVRRAIYNIGFERGLNEWREYLKTGGYIAVTESSWFTDERPGEIHDFWIDAYPEIDTIPNQVASIHKAGYLPVASFILPENCWTEHYFTPKIAAKDIFSANTQEIKQPKNSPVFNPSKKNFTESIKPSTATHSSSQKKR